MTDTTTIPTEHLRALFDIATGSMDFGSGFLDTEEVEHLRAIAVALGVDPVKATPSEFLSQYPHPYTLFKYSSNVAYPERGCSVTRCGKAEDDPIHQAKPEASR